MTIIQGDVTFITGTTTIQGIQLLFKNVTITECDYYLGDMTLNQGAWLLFMST